MSKQFPEKVFKGNEDTASATIELEQHAIDTIEIKGKFISPCIIPVSIKLREYNVLSSVPQLLIIETNGEFSYRLLTREPRQVTLRTSKISFDFIVTPKEKTYHIEVRCEDGVEKFTVVDSRENKAFLEFVEANQLHNSDLDGFIEKDLSDKSVFSELQKVFKDYQSKLTSIASSAPETLTANMLCAAERLPEKWLESIESLRKNFLVRETLANPQFYNNFLSSRIVINYMEVLQDKKDTSFVMVGRALEATQKNPEAAKRLQQVLHDLLYYWHEENLLKGFVSWAELHPAEMVNESVKKSLSSFKKVLPGSPMIEVLLKDPKGAEKKLSETVSSSKLTLLFFYSPTCAHCQEEIPLIVPIWNKYKSKGLKIYSVAFNSTDEEWKTFIKNKASEEWTHVFEPSSGNEPSAQYLVNYTPTYIFIDSKGKIITRFPKMNDLEKMITEWLK